MSERYRITDDAMAAAIIEQLEAELFFPIKELQPDLYLYSAAQLQADFSLSTDILSDAQENRRLHARWVAWCGLVAFALLLLMFSFDNAAWVFSMSFGAALGRCLIHAYQLRRQSFIINEMSHLLPFLARAIKVVTHCGLQKVVIAKVHMKTEEKVEDYTLSSPNGNVICFQFHKGGHQ